MKRLVTEAALNLKTLYSAAFNFSVVPFLLFQFLNLARRQGQYWGWTLRCKQMNYKSVGSRHFIKNKIETFLSSSYFKMCWYLYNKGDQLPTRGAAISDYALALGTSPPRGRGRCLVIKALAFGSGLYHTATTMPVLNGREELVATIP